MQNELFGNQRQIITLQNGELHFYPDWLDKQASVNSFDNLLKTIHWQQTPIRIAGKLIPIPRLNAWYGDSDSGYRYSGVSFEPLPWMPELSAIKHKLVETLANDFSAPPFYPNSVLANLYRDGNDSVAWHADDEPELGASPQIASISLGDTRRFLLKPKHKVEKVEPVELALTDGSLLLMLGDLQQYWLHAIPKTKKLVGRRINLTFRQILG